MLSLIKVLEVRMVGKITKVLVWSGLVTAVKCKGIDSRAVLLPFSGLLLTY